MLSHGFWRTPTASPRCSPNPAVPLAGISCCIPLLLPVLGRGANSSAQHPSSAVGTCFAVIF